MPNWYGSYSSWASKVDFKKLTHVNLAFALADSNGQLGLAPAAEIDAFVGAAHDAGVKVFPSLCGGGGDPKITPYYQPDKVDAFVDNIIAFAEAHDMDGVDVDVEAPNKMGATYDTFIKKLIEKAHPKGLEVTAAVAPWMQWGMSDATLKSFDFITIMSYDNTGTWTGAGAHSSYEQAEDALDYYSAKGVSKDKLVLGVPFYGYCWGTCAGKGNQYILYKDIIGRFAWADTVDWIDQNESKYSFNGTATMKKKTELALEYGGIMIWELAGDLETSDARSLLRAIDEVLQ
jgi:GH18 family chitinase